MEFEHLFTIGDSISQGFTSGAAAESEATYSSNIARVLKIQSYQYPKWPKFGLPLNIEFALRKLEE